MASLARLVLLGLALSAAPATASPCAGGGAARSGVCEEVEAEAVADLGVQLLQVSRQRVSDGQAESLELASKQIPGLDGILSAGRGIISDATAVISNASSSNLGDIISSGRGIISDATGMVSNVTSSIGSLSTAAALAAASTLNQTLLILGAHGIKIQGQCDQLKEAVMSKLNETINDTATKVAVFEEQLTSAVNTFLPYWGNISTAIEAATAAAASALEAVGQDDIGSILTKNVRIALDEGDSFAESLGEVSQKLAGLKDTAVEELGEALEAVKSKFDQSSEQVDAVAEQLGASFADLTKEAAAKIEASIPSANATAIDAAFESVRQTAAQVVDELLKGPKGLVGDLSAVTAATRAEVAPGEKGGAGVKHPLASVLGALLLLVAHAA